MMTRLLLLFYNRDKEYRIVKALLIVTTMFAIQAGTAQETNSQAIWNAFVSIGYSGATASDVESYYNLIVDSYRQDGLPIHTRTPFGKTAVFSGGILLSRLETIKVGISLSYLYSSAASNYQDNTGALNVNGEVNSYQISLLIKATMAKIVGLPVNLSVRPGASYAISAITQALRISDSPQNNNDWKWSAEEWGPFAQATLGTSVPIGTFELSFDAGYLFAWNTVLIQRIESGAGDRSFNTPIDIGLSGIVFLVSLGMSI